MKNAAAPVASKSAAPAATPAPLEAPVASKSAAYYFMGGDNKEYGPYSADQIKRLGGENRLNANFNVRTTKGDWKPASTYPELGFQATSVPAATPSSMGGEDSAAYLQRIRENTCYESARTAVGFSSILLYCAGGGIVVAGCYYGSNNGGDQLYR